MSELDLTPDEQATLDRLYTISEEGTLYELLDVAPDADRKEIQAAFYELSRSWHPDRFFRKETGDYADKIEMVFVAITEAWRTLGSDASRYSYDLAKRSLIDARHRAPAPAAGPSAAEPSAIEAPARRARPPRAATTSARPSSPRVAARREQALDEIRKQVVERLKKARRHYQEAIAHHEAGRVMKANSAIQLARTFDSKNADIARLADLYQREARKLQSKSYVAAAESADSFANYREALSNYRKAVDYGTDHARSHYRLGLLTKRVDEDRREALKHMRSAIMMEPDNIEFRMGIGELYEELGLTVNAKAQYERVLKLDKFHLDAKERLKNMK